MGRSHRRRFGLPLAAALALPLVVPVGGATAAPGDASTAIRVLGSYDNGGEGSAEIVAHDPDSQRLFVVDAANAALVILDATDMSRIDTIDVSGDGDPNSVAVRPGTGSGDGLVAVALGNGTDPGFVGFYDVDGTQLSIVTVGDFPAGTDASLPDMVTFTHDGQKLLVANEGEYDPGDPTVNGDDTDPEGGISIIDTSGDPAAITAAQVTDRDFRAFNATHAGFVGEETSGYHFDPTAATIAQDVEPEYIAVAPDDETAYVSLQEVNAVAVVDLTTDAITTLLPLGYIDRSVSDNGFGHGNGLDGSDDDGEIDIATYDGLFGMPQPDSIAAYTVGGTDYFVTANEGDARALDVEGTPYDSDAAERSVADTLTDQGFNGPSEDLATDGQIGPLLLTPWLGDTDGTGDEQSPGNGDFEELYHFGTRSFSIYDETGSLVFDSGDFFEQYIATNFPEAFNADDPIAYDDNGTPGDASDDALDSDFDNRSDDKGPEPEGLAIGEIDGTTYAFVGLERQGGFFVFDITDPTDVSFIEYITSRNLTDYTQGVFDVDGSDTGVDRGDGMLIDGGDLIDPVATGGDVSPEGLWFVDAADSPTGRAALAVAHEVSGTVTMFDLETALTEPAAAATPPAGLPSDTVDVRRAAGRERIHTANLIAELTYDSADTVFLARADDYADALMGGPLAGLIDAPILLSYPDGISQGVLDTIADLGAAEVVLLGGTAALSQTVEDQLEGAGLTTRRLSGQNRFLTAAAIADEIAGDADVDTLFVVESADPDPNRGWPDALSVGPYAAGIGSPVLGVTSDILPDGTRAAIAALAPSEIVVVGGGAAVSDDVVDQLAIASGLDPDEGEIRRLSGSTRWGTNGAVYDEAIAHGLTPQRRWLATGTNFPDALTAGAAAGALMEPLVLGFGPDIAAAQETVDRLSSAPDVLEEIVIAGGGAAVALSAESTIQDLVRPDMPAADLCLTVLHNNDGESQLIDAGRGIEDFGGAARFATRLLTERTRAGLDRDDCTEEASITVTSGDNFLAGPELNASRDHGVPFYDSLLLDYLNYDAIDLGNHDFDFGPNFTADFMAGFTDDTPFLSANTAPSREPALALQVNMDRLQPSTTVDVGSHTVGIIGLTTPLLRTISSPRGVGVFGAPDGELDLDLVAAFVAEEVANVQADGADIVVVISHLQDIDQDLSLVAELSDVDIVVAGGGDEVLAVPGTPLVPGDESDVFGTYPLEATNADGVGVPVVTTAGDYKYVGRLVTRFDTDGDLLGVDPWSRMVRVAGGDLFDAVTPDPWVQANVVDPVETFVAGLAADVIATSEVDLDGTRTNVRSQETNVGDLLADAMVWAAEESAADFGLDPDATYVGVANGGGIRNNTVIPTGDFTRLDTFDIAPFSNFVAVFRDVTEDELTTIFEHAYGAIEVVDGAVEGGDGKFAQVANLSIEVDPSAPEGSRVQRVTLLNGDPIPAGGVNLVLPDFVARGGDDYPVDGLGDFTVVGTSYQQALADYVVEGLAGTIAAADYPFIADDANNATRIVYTAP